MIPNRGASKYLQFYVRVSWAKKGWETLPYVTKRAEKGKFNFKKQFDIIYLLKTDSKSFLPGK